MEKEKDSECEDKSENVQKEFQEEDNLDEIVEEIQEENKLEDMSNFFEGQQFTEIAPGKNVSLERDISNFQDDPTNSEESSFDSLESNRGDVEQKPSQDSFTNYSTIADYGELNKEKSPEMSNFNRNDLKTARDIEFSSPENSFRQDIHLPMDFERFEKHRNTVEPDLNVPKYVSEEKDNAIFDSEKKKYQLR
jgi:hypothetical protein